MTMPDPGQTPRTNWPSRLVRRAREQVTGVRLLGAVVIALTVATGVQGYAQSKALQRQSEATQHQGQVTERLTQCIKAYSNQLADAIEQRSKAAGEAQDASDALWFAVAQAPQTPEGRDHARKVFDDYIAKRAAAKKAQADHPYPPPPRDVC